jgi:hypothetical protein
MSMMLKPLANSIKQSTQRKGGGEKKKEQIERTQGGAREEQNPKDGQYGAKEQNQKLLHSTEDLY